MSGFRRIVSLAEFRHPDFKGVFVLSSPIATVVAVCVAVAFTACFAVACVTARSIAKAALADTRSADRPLILKQLVAVLRALFTFFLRRR